MERRFQIRLGELLKDAEVCPGLLKGVMPRLEFFLQPFVQALQSAEQRTNAQHYIQGLLSDLKGKDVESIAYLHDRERQGLQKFIGQAEWNHRPLVTELARQIGAELGEEDGVLVFDPSAFAKKGHESVGVQRQWPGGLAQFSAKIAAPAHRAENCRSSWHTARLWVRAAPPGPCCSVSRPRAGNA
jgi:SRSO17 transposase